MEKMELPKGWVFISYNELFTQVSTTNKKIKTKDMLDAGKYPVIDQSESFISGFYNDEIKLVHIQQPVIVFGDHTRCFKWIDFSFVPGADGIQVLLPNEPLEARYMFYALKTLTLPNKGYSRHFKFLKEERINIASLNEQKEIVRIIESHLKLVDQIKSRLDALPKILEQFRQSVLASAVSGGLTGIEVKGVRVLEDYVSIENGARKPVSAAIRKGIQGEIPYIGATGVIDYLNDRTHVGRYLLVGEDGANLLTKTKDLAFIFDGEMWVNNHAHVLKEKEGVDLDFIKIVINAMDLKPWVTGSAQPKLTQRALRALPIPYYLESEQKEIVKRVEILFTLADQIESKTKNAQERVNLLTQSILAKAFRGEFTAKWREDNPDLISGENSAEALLKRIEEAKKAAKKKK